MRVVVGATAIAQGILYLSDIENRTLQVDLVCLTLTGCGAFLVIGFLTPAVSVLVAIASLGDALSLFPVLAGNLFGGKLASVEMIVMAAAIALLGPGAFSLDSRLFGRHEIVIPPSSRAPKS
jgi:uncharacterized membrane protein YphA (DoxX/SURF4 family)